jgi:hypothetical protein
MMGEAPVPYGILFIEECDHAIIGNLKNISIAMSNEICRRIQCKTNVCMGHDELQDVT